jgi:hypothetical protein
MAATTWCCHGREFSEDPGQVKHVDLGAVSERRRDGAGQHVAPEEEHLQRLELPEL